MPYRTLARNEHAELDQAEIDGVAHDAKRRVRRAAAGLAATFALVWGGAVAAASNQTPPARLHCHKVILQYEDSLHAREGIAPPPPAIHSVCEWR